MLAGDIDRQPISHLKLDSFKQGHCASLPGRLLPQDVGVGCELFEKGGTLKVPAVAEARVEQTGRIVIRSVRGPAPGEGGACAVAAAVIAGDRRCSQACATLVAQVERGLGSDGEVEMIAVMHNRSGVQSDRLAEVDEVAAGRVSRT